MEEIYFGSSKRGVRVSKDSSYRESPVYNSTGPGGVSYLSCTGVFLEKTITEFQQTEITRQTDVDSYKSWNRGVNRS